MAPPSELLDPSLSTASTGLFPEIVQDPLALANYNTSSAASRAESEPILAAAPASPLATPPFPGSSDPGNTLGTAEDWGRLSDRTASLAGTIGRRGDSNDFFRLSVDGRTNLSARLSNLSADIDLELIWDKNTNGQIDSGEVIASSLNSGNSADSLSLILGSTNYPSGTYFIRVFPGTDGAATEYSLTFSGTELSKTIRPQSDPVNIWRYDTGGRTERGNGSYQGIDPDKETVVVIHGWQNSDQDPQLRELAKEASEFSNVQVLAVDWGSIANAGLDSGTFDVEPIETAKWIAPVARWVYDRLVYLGIDADQLTFVGHSLGAYVSSETANQFDNKEDKVDNRVKNLVALDPAFRANGYDIDRDKAGEQNPEDFRRVAKYSLSLVVKNVPFGAAGDNDKATTAQDSLIVDFPARIPGAGASAIKAIEIVHRGAVDTFTAALNRRLLTLPNPKLPDHRNDWYTDNGNLNAFGTHEGRIDVSQTGYAENWSDGENPWRIEGLTQVVDTTLGIPDEKTIWT